jgi:hypothetical protein
MTSFSSTLEPIASTPSADTGLAPRPAEPSAYWPKAQRALIGALVAGIAVAMAPAIPSVARDLVLVLGLGLWAWCVGAAVLGGLVALRRTPPTHRAWLAIGCGGLLVALLLSVELELIRLLGARPAFTWIHDWRWALNHAQAIVASGGVGAALDYSGAAIDYHVGPAWLAAAVQRIAGMGVADVLFGAIPLLCVLTVTLGGTATLRSMGVASWVAFPAIVLALTLPLSHVSVLSLESGVQDALLSPLTWPFLPSDMMLNTLLGFAVGMAGVALLLDRSTGIGLACLAGAGLGAVVQIKPQYYAGFALLATVLGTAGWLRSPVGGARNRVVLAGAVLSLPLALLTMKLLPGNLAYFDVPQWASTDSRGPFVEAIRVTSVLGLGALVTWLVARAGRLRRTPTVVTRLLLPAGVALAALAALLYFIDFPYRPALVDRLVTLEFAPRSSAVFGDEALAQSLEPPRFLVLSAALAAMILLLSGGPRAWRWAALAGATLIGLAPLPLTLAGFVSPPREYGAAEDEDLRALLAQVPRSHTLLASSDLADPADDFKRALRAPLLTAYGGHSFYVSNLRYVHYARVDALERIAELRAFFGTPWSPGHEAWLERTGITHLLVHDRCPAAWESSAATPMDRVATSGRWRMYQSRPSTRRQDATMDTSAVGPVPRYGRAACLSGETAPAPIPAPGAGRSGGGRGTTP